MILPGSRQTAYRLMAFAVDANYALSVNQAIAAAKAFEQFDLLGLRSLSFLMIMPALQR